MRENQTGPEPEQDVEGHMMKLGPEGFIGEGPEGFEGSDALRRMAKARVDEPAPEPEGVMRDRARAKRD